MTHTTPRPHLALTSPREVARDPKLTSPLAPLPMGGEVNDPRDLAPGATGDQPRPATRRDTYRRSMRHAAPPCGRLHTLRSPTTPRTHE
jgi:hypothetical protein